MEVLIAFPPVEALVVTKRVLDGVLVTLNNSGVVSCLRIKRFLTPKGAVFQISVVRLTTDIILVNTFIDDIWKTTPFRFRKFIFFRHETIPKLFKKLQNTI